MGQEGPYILSIMTSDGVIHFQLEAELDYIHMHMATSMKGTSHSELYKTHHFIFLGN